MTIMVRVVSNRAQAQLAALRAQQAGLTSGIAAANRQEPLGRRHITSLMKFGNQLQWTGRMLQYNFTLPILAAGVAATHFAMEQEKAFVHVSKVYGDTQAAAAQFRKEMGLGRKAAERLAESYEMDELKALDAAFTAISAHYGVQKKEVNEVAGAWAAAGASGLDLAKSVDQTMQAIIIGDMNAMDATKALISIQAQYNLSTQELQSTLANLNSIENQTGANMADLIIGFEKAAGVARSAGIETNQLAAYMAALVPASGSASTAGNALKTIFSRLLNPTKETSQVLEAMGIAVHDLAWQSAPVSDQLQIMADKFEGLGKKAQGVVSSVVASRWQVNRFEILMREINSTTGYYAKALEAAKDDGESFTRMQKELNTVLESDPRKMQRMFVMLQNASVEIIQPLIPHIIYLADRLAALAQAFADLDPHTQKLVLLLLLLLAAIGPVVRYFGALNTLFGVVGHVLVVVADKVWLLVKVMKYLLVPFQMLGTVAMGAVGAMSAALTAGLTAITGVISGAFVSWAAITARGWAIQVGIWRTALALKMGMFTVFVTKFRMAMILAMTTGTSTWAAFWTAMKLMTVTGLATQFVLFRKFMGIIAIMKVLGTAITVTWTRTWAMVGAVNAAGWALIRAQWIAGSIMGIGLWSKFRTAFLAIHATTAAAALTIWRGFALNFVATGRAAVAGFIGIFKGLIPFLLRFGKFLVTPWGIAALAVMGIIYAFRDQIFQVWNNIVNYLSDQSNGISRGFANVGNAIMSVFNKLPGGVQRAMVAVVTVVRDAALAVYEWFSYINPFARHSPSLVENVENGMNTILAKFSRLSEIKKYTTAAYAEIKKFSEMTSKIGLNVQAAERKDDRKALKKAGGGAALGSYNQLIKLLNKLQPILGQLEAKIAAQENVVDRWQKKVDEANDKLEEQQKKLDRLNDKLQKYQDALSKAQADLEYFASAPLVGMREMEDQIFANQMAQTKLRLEMMNMEDVVGTFDDLKEKMESINGLQEIMRGEQANLRAAGAGSDILNQYDNEINKLEDQKVVYTETADKLNAMQVELQKLQREAEKLDLVKAMKFDELEYAIARAADQTKELSFDEIMSGIAGANAEIAKYGPLVDAATKAVEEQQVKVDEATAARDRLQDRLDVETAQLEVLKGKYNEVNDAISAIESTIGNVIDAAEKMTDALAAKKDKKGKGAEPYISPGLQNFMDAGNATFPDPGGKGIPPRTDWSNQSDEIKKWTEQLGQDTASMFADLNPFAPLKEKALKVWDWIKDKAEAVAGKVGEFFGAAFDDVSIDSSKLEGVKKTLSGAVEFITQVASDIAKPFKWAYQLLWPQIKKIGKGIWDGLKDVWEKVGPKLEEFSDLWEPIGNAIKNAWTIAKPFLALFTGGLLASLTILLAMIGEAIGPAIEAIGTILGGLIDLIRGIVKIIVGIFTLDLGMIISGVSDIFEGLWGVIAGIVGGGIRVVWNLIQGFVFGIRDFFVWLWDVLVGHSIVPDIVNGIIDAFAGLANLAQWVWDNVLKPVWDFFKSLWQDHLKDFLFGMWDKIKTAWALLKLLGQWVWDNVLKPVKDFFVSLWADHVRPKLAEWWENIKLSWALLKLLGQWVWDHVLKPVKDFFVGLWNDHVSPKLGEWWENIKTAWDNLKGLGEWVTKNVMDPVVSAFKTGWQSIKQWFLDNADILFNPVASVVNFVLGAINTMIKGLNKVADVLPGIEWHIDEIPKIDKLAAGGPIPGRSATRGFMTSGARAIVGEGKANYPEFVIPTDPTHRNRAKSLLAMAAQKMGMNDAASSVRNSTMTDGHGIPMFSIGGWLSEAWDDTKNLGNKLANLPKKAVSKIMDKALDKAADKVNKIGWQPIESPPEMAIAKLRAWVTGVDDNIAKKLDSMVPAGGDVPVANPNAPSALEYWGGGLFTRKFIAHMEKAEELAGSGISVIQGGFRPETSYSGTSHEGDALDMQVNYRLLHALRRVGIASGDRTGLGDWKPHIHAIPGPGAGYGAGSAPWQWSDYMARGGAGQSPTSPWGLKTGGIVRRTTGGVPITAGDGRYDEAVVPLPYGWQNLRGNASGNRTININGDLSFPNITNPNDADEFLRNIETLARD